MSTVQIYIHVWECNYIQYIHMYVYNYVKLQSEINIKAGLKFGFSR